MAVRGAEVGTQVHVGDVGIDAVFQAHLNGRSAGGNGELVDFGLGAFQEVALDDLDRADGAQVGVKERPVAGESEGADVGADPVAAGVHTLAHDGRVVSPPGNCGLAGHGQEQVIFVAGFLEFAPARDVLRVVGGGGDVGEVVLLEDQHGLAQVVFQVELPVGLVGRDDDLVIGGLAGGQGGVGDRAGEVESADSDGHAGSDAAAGDGVSQGA